MSVLKEWVLHEPAAHRAAEEAPDHTLFLGDLSALGVCTLQAPEHPFPRDPPLPDPAAAALQDPSRVWTTETFCLCLGPPLSQPRRNLC